MRVLIQSVDVVLEIYSWLLFAVAAIYWVTEFNVVSAKNHLVVVMSKYLTPITEPALRPIRYVLPPRGGIDASPISLILLLLMFRYLLVLYVLPIHF